MTVSNVILMIILGCSIPLAVFIVRSSNRKVEDLDGLGEVVKNEGKKGIVVAQI